MTSETAQEFLQRQIAQIRRGAPGRLSSDGAAFCVFGSLGVDCYVSPDGDAFVEEYDIGDDSPAIRIGGPHGRIKALVLGAQRYPVLSEFLPTRPEDAVACEVCGGEGFLNFITRGYFICHDCCGLGWTSASFFGKFTGSAPNGQEDLPLQ
jgi:hypothetical protein